MELTNGVAANLLPQLSEFRGLDEKRNGLFQKLIEEVNELHEKCKGLEYDNKSERISRQVLQEQVDELNEELGLRKRREAQSAHVLVLLDADGDGYVFHNRYICRGAEGGKHAAQDLQKFIQDHLKDKVDANTPIMVRAYANVEGLSRTMNNAGMGGVAQNMTSFVEGFNRIRFCDFVQVGKGKDGADEKIKVQFEHARHDPSCRHIVLGVCHDNGYTNMLEQVADPEGQSRITLLASLQTGREFANLKHLNRVKADGLFRTEFIKGATPVLGTEGSASETLAKQCVPSMPKSKAQNPIAPLGFEALNGQSAKPETFARIAQVPGDGSGPICKDPVHDMDRSNVHQRRDSALMPCAPGAVQSYKAKLKRGKRFCKDYFLARDCARSPCEFLHAGLSKEEIEVFRADALSQPCWEGARCEKAFCYYGHRGAR